jgi:hypothetical protein
MAHGMATEMLMPGRSIFELTKTGAAGSGLSAIKFKCRRQS